VIPLQEVNFHLTYNEVVFAHLVQLHDRTFSAQVTEPHSMDALPVFKFYRWLPCQSNSSAAGAFIEILNALKSYGSLNDRSLIKVNNPGNTEFLSVHEQLNILSSTVPVTVNELI
jgi:hypothetical protein